MKPNLHIIIPAVLFAFGMQAQNVDADSLKKVARTLKSDTAKANAFNKIANLYRESSSDSAAFYARKAEALSKKSDYRFGIAAAKINIGNSEIIGGDYKKALESFKSAQQILSSLLEDDKNNRLIQNSLGRAFASSAVVYSEEGDYARSITDYMHALKHFSATTNKPMMARVYNNISVVYKSQGNNEKALEHLQNALEIQLKAGDLSAATTLMNIGEIHFRKNELNQAKSYYERAGRLFEKSHNKREWALLYSHWGDFYSKLGDSESAMENYSRSREMYAEMGNKFGLSLVLYNIARLLSDKNDIGKAIENAQKSSDMARETGILNQVFHSEKLLSELWEKQGNPEKALLHYKNYATAKDSISNQETMRKFALAEMDFEYQKKESLLREKNKRQTQILGLGALAAILLIGLIVVIYNRRQVKRRLTLQKEVAEYEQKALHLQMNPHFVFNCLGSISSFIVQNGTDSALKYLSKFSKLMRLTLEYSKGSLIPIDKEIESLQNYLELEKLRFHDKFDFDIRSSETVEFNMGLPPLLVQPFVENAILHGMVPKQGNGFISIAFDAKDGQLYVTISDDGIGISQSRHLKENSMTAHKSMALEITKKRLEIMESTTAKSAQIEIIDLSESGQNGTKVILKLPIQYMP